MFYSPTGRAFSIRALTLAGLSRFEDYSSNLFGSQTIMSLRAEDMAQRSIVGSSTHQLNKSVHDPRTAQ